MSAVAEHKGINLEDFSVDIERVTRESEGLYTNFIVYVNLPSGYNEREKALLFNAARKCDVMKMLEGNMEFTYQLDED